MDVVYISGGITGVVNYKRHFDDAERELEKQGYAVANPVTNATALLNIGSIANQHGMSI